MCVLDIMLTVRKSYKHGEEANLLFEVQPLYSGNELLLKKLKTNINVPVQEETYAAGKQALSSLRNCLFNVRM